MRKPSSDVREVSVWDLVLRLLHWWNALFLLAQLTSGTLMVLRRDDVSEAGFQTIVDIHSAAGYALAAGVFTRLIWLIIGPPTAQWRDLLPLKPYQRRELVATLRFYLKGLRGEAPVYLAHNAFAGVVYVAFFVIACTQVVGGAILLEMLPQDRLGSSLHEFHEIGFFLLILFVVAHLIAVVVHEVVEDRGLVRAMLSGRKRFTPKEIHQLKQNHKLEGDK